MFHIGKPHSRTCSSPWSMKNVRLVKSRREGKTVFYSLADDHVKTIIDQGLEHVRE